MLKNQMWSVNFNRIYLFFFYYIKYHIMMKLEHYRNEDGRENLIAKLKFFFIYTIHSKKLIIYFKRTLFAFFLEKKQ